jgi:hypothetical protein
MHPHEVAGLTQLAAAGAHPEILAQVFGRDPRTIRAVLAQAGVQPRLSAPPPADWRRELPPATVAAVHAYVAQLHAREQAAWKRLRQAAVDVGGATYVFPSLAAYDTVLQTVQPPEALLRLTRRLGVDVNRVLMAYAEAAETMGGQEHRRV